MATAVCSTKPKVIISLGKDIIRLTKVHGYCYYVLIFILNIFGHFYKLSLLGPTKHRQ